MECCGCIYVASVNTDKLGPFTPVDPYLVPSVPHDCSEGDTDTATAEP